MTESEMLGDLIADRKLLIFDFDGTVADTSPLHAAAFEKVLAPLSVSVDYPKVAGMRTADAMRVLLQSHGVCLSPSEIVALVQAKQRTVRSLISHRLNPLGGVDDFLRWAKSRYLLSLATSGSRETVALALKALGYEGWFEPVVCGEDVVRGKPAPDALLQVLAITGMAAQEAFVFEDSEFGFAAAEAAGIAWCDAREMLHKSMIIDTLNPRLFPR
jgi:HAD superfamily hydrolase (TIGR01509 family)